MAFLLKLQYLEHLDVKADRIIKATFRDYEQISKCVRGKDSIYFGDRFEWPLARPLDTDDAVEIQVYNYNKYLVNKFIGSFQINLYLLIEQGSLKLQEHLLDSNNSALPISLSFQMEYVPPGNESNEWRQSVYHNKVHSSQDDVSLIRHDNPFHDHESKHDLSHCEEEEPRIMSVLNRGNDNADVISMNSIISEGLETIVTSPRRTANMLAGLEANLHKIEDYQISLTIIEARQLAGANINPSLEVRIGDKTKKTEIKMSTNSPFYNQYFCFDFRMSKAELLDQVIHIRALAMGSIMISRLLPGDVIGEFRMDVKTVYNAPDHLFFHKWAMLVDPRDILSGSKGYVKLDIQIVGRGEMTKYKPKPTAKSQKLNEEEDIEANLLLPQNVKSAKRQMAELAVKIYRAEDLPRMNTDFVASIKQAFTGEAKPLIDPYVQVSFAGHSSKTKSKKSTYTPEWNEEIIFTIMFPSLCNRIRISVYDMDAVYNECIATHFIELNQIMCDGEQGFLPTFGPSWVNLYGTPRNYSYEQMMRPREELNRGLGEGVAYRGRLLMAIKTTIKNDTSGFPSGARVGPTYPITEGVIGKKEDFLLVGIVYEASAIDNEIGRKKSPITFELSIGTAGNHLDGRFAEDEDNDVDDSNENAPLLGSKKGTSLTKVSGNRQVPIWCHSMTPPLVPQTNDMEYYHVPFESRKPCVYMRYQCEDQRPRLYVTNILTKLKEKFSHLLEEVQDMVNAEHKCAYRRLRTVLTNVISDIEGSQSAIKHCQGSGGRTVLDKERHRLIRMRLERLKVKALAMRTDCNRTNLVLRMREARAMLKLLCELTNEPQDSLPDVFVWMIVDNKRLAYARLPSRSLIHSSTPEEIGKDCGKVITIFLRKPGHKGMGQAGWVLQGQLKMYLWLGLVREMKAYVDGVPLGYQPDTFKQTRPPHEVIYADCITVQLRAHMFMARNLIGSDDTGLSDAFARIILNDHVVTTRVIHETLSPKWDQTLIIPNMKLHYNEDTLMDHPPVIIVEVYDEDIVGKAEFLGRSFVQPQVTLYRREPYQMPKLEWWPLYRGQSNAGEILAAIELIQILPEDNYILPTGVPSIDDISCEHVCLPGKEITSPVMNRDISLLSTPTRAFSALASLLPSRVSAQLPTSPPPSATTTSLPLTDTFNVTLDYVGNHSTSVISVPVPPQIRPLLRPYRVEIIFWGMRELQRVQLLQVDRPKVSIEFGGIKIQSDIIGSMKNKPNFPNPLKYVDLHLPSNQRYWPPLMIQCEDCRQFGRTVLVGNHMISNPTKYLSKAMSSGASDASTRVKSLTNSLSRDAQNAFLDRTHLSKDTLPSLLSRVDSSIPISVKQTASEDQIPLMELQKNRESSLPKDSIVSLSKTGPQVTLSPQNVSGGQKTSTTSPPPVSALPGAVTDVKKRSKMPKEFKDDVDWWTKYYASVEDSEKQNAVEEELDETELLKDVEVMDIVSEGDNGGVVTIPEETSPNEEETKGKRKSKKKKDKSKAKKKSGWPLSNLSGRFAIFTDDGKKAFFNEQDEAMADGGESERDDNSWAERVTIYPSALEDVKEFCGFVSFVKTYPLYRGKQEDDEELPENRIVGLYKGNILIYPIEEEKCGKEAAPNELILYKDLPSNNPVTLLARIYIIRAHDLHPADPNGKSDPYLVVQMGNKVINERDKYIPKNLNPVFGKCFELEVTFPQESMLTITVMDWDLISGDDLIGETKIDLENRYYSRHRACCGLARNYDNFGYNKWRDQLNPTQILAKMCKEYGFAPPRYEPVFSRVTVAGCEFHADALFEDESGEMKTSNEPLALKALQEWESVPNGCPLVPEHIETRPLFNPEKPGIEQGRLEMWVDLFPKELGCIPLKVDVYPRIPKSYELRVIIWNTEDVILNDDGVLTGEKSSDIFLKGWIKGLGIDDQVTDVHYRSLSGEGNFNWRFIFPYDYLRAEDRIVYSVRDSPFSIDETELKAPCKLYLQVWDADIVSADDFLGALELPLSKIPRGAKSSQTCGLHQLATDGSVPTFSIFHNKRCRGWWPFTAESEEESKEIVVTGKVDAELQLLTKEEAEQNPAGLGREEPNGLPQPNRPDGSFLWFMNPLKTCKHIIWKNYKWLILKLIIVCLLALLLLLFIYSSPGYLAKKIIGA